MMESMWRSGQTTRRHGHYGLLTIGPLRPTATKRPLPDRLPE